MTLLTLALLAATPQDIPESLPPLGFLPGTWIEEGGKHESRIEWMLEGRFLKAEHWSRSEDPPRLVSTTILGVDHEKKRLISHVFHRNGGIGRTECVAEKKSVWTFQGKVTSPKSTYEARVTTTKSDPDQFGIDVEQKEDAAFAPAGTCSFKRKK